MRQRHGQLGNEWAQGEVLGTKQGNGNYCTMARVGMKIFTLVSDEGTHASF